MVGDWLLCPKSRACICHSRFLPCLIGEPFLLHQGAASKNLARHLRHIPVTLYNSRRVVWNPLSSHSGKMCAGVHGPCSAFASCHSSHSGSRFHPGTLADILGSLTKLNCEAARCGIHVAIALMIGWFLLLTFLCFLFVSLSLSLSGPFCVHFLCK